VPGARRGGSGNGHVFAERAIPIETDGPSQRRGVPEQLHIIAQPFSRALAETSADGRDTAADCCLAA
jgi:hypothetical protein